MVVEAILYVMIILDIALLNIRRIELKAQRDAYKEKLKTYLQGSWGCGWEEPFNKAVKEIEGDSE